MYKASADILLPTSVIGSLPRPAWHTASLGRQTFLEAMMNAPWREQTRTRYQLICGRRKLRGRYLH